MLVNILFSMVEVRDRQVLVRVTVVSFMGVYRSCRHCHPEVVGGLREISKAKGQKESCND